MPAQSSHARGPALSPRSLAINLTLAAVTTAASFLIAELAFQAFLGSDLAIAKPWQQARYYATYSNDNDAWILRHQWNESEHPPIKPHPLLGWLPHYISFTTYVHDQAKDLGSRRPVLLYGDSFAQGVRQVERFQKILAADTEFSRHHLLVNYGAGGYGLDQIYLLFQQSVDLYQEPFVVFSFLTNDIDRSMVSVRTGAKPHFELVDGSLELRGVPIPEDLEAFFRANPPRIRSYLWNRFLHIQRRPGKFFSWLRGEEEKRRRKKVLNRAILEQVVVELEERELEYIFLVFSTQRSFRHGPDWRDIWLRDQLTELGVEFIWALDVLRRDAPDATQKELFLHANGHPTTWANQLVAREIKRRVLSP